jgi:hypothetical protein
VHAGSAASGPMHFSALPGQRAIYRDLFGTDLHGLDARQKSSEASRQRWLLPPKGPPMFTADRYRGKAIEHAKLARTASGPDELPDCKAFESRCVELTGTAQGLTGISDRVMRLKDHVAGRPRRAGSRQRVGDPTGSVIPRSLSLVSSPTGFFLRSIGGLRSGSSVTGTSILTLWISAMCASLSSSDTATR